MKLTAASTFYDFNSEADALETVQVLTLKTLSSTEIFNTDTSISLLDHFSRLIYELIWFVAESNGI